MSSGPDPAPDHVQVGRIQRVLASRLAGDAGTLYVVHVVGMLVPLLTIPYLARVLRPTAWGTVVFAQSLGAWLALVVEYGFDLSATRAVARHRDSRSHLVGLAAGVQGGKLILLLGLLPAVLAMFWLIPIFRQQPALLVWACVFAMVRGYSPAWYFLGMERVRAPAIAETGAKVVAALGIFVLVHHPGHAWRVLALQAVAMTVTMCFLTMLMNRELPFRAPRLAQSIRTLRESFEIFVFRSSSGLFLQANAFILGLLATPQVVGFFGGAEKIIRAAINLLHPLSQALFPRVIRSAATDPEETRRLLLTGLVLFVSLGMIMGVTALGAAPILVRVLLGPEYGEAVPVLRVLSVLPPLIAIGTLFGIQWALPAGLERPFYRLVVAAGILNILLAALLVPRYGALGMAVSIAIAEVLVAGGLILVFLSKGGRLWPFALPVLK